MYVQRKNEASYEQRYCGRIINITYCKCVFVALVIQHTKRMCHIVVFGLTGCKKFFHPYLINGTFFSGGVGGRGGGGGGGGGWGEGY